MSRAELQIVSSSSARATQNPVSKIERESGVEALKLTAPLIVCIGLDPMLLFTRAGILTSAGYRVIVEDPDLILSRLEGASPALFLFCQTIPDEISHTLAAEIRHRHPESKALLLVETPQDQYDKRIFTSTFRPLEGPEALLVKAGQLLATP